MLVFSHLVVRRVESPDFLDCPALLVGNLEGFFRQALDSNASGWISAVELWPEAGVLVCSHSSGIGFLDMRAGNP